MKKKLLSLTMGLCLSALTAVPTMAQSYYSLRLGAGTYYDYLCVETTDGNAIFKDGGSVIVLFDTMGTAEIEDDVILDVLNLN